MFPLPDQNEPIHDESLQWPGMEFYTQKAFVIYTLRNEGFLRFLG